MAEETGGISADCPRCDEPIDGDEDACPNCGLEFLDPEGGLSEDAMQALLDNADVTLPTEGGDGGFSAPKTIRLFVALAITIPMAPLVAFIGVSVFPLPTWASVVLATLGWVVPAYLLARFRVPTLVVANGLLLIGLTMATTPLVIIGGRTILGTDPGDIGALGSNVFAAQSIFLAFGLVVLAVGLLVRRYAVATRARWEREAAESREPDVDNQS